MWIKDFITRYHNAKKAIAQIRAGEWEPLWNSLALEHLTAHRDGLELWLGNGPWFCEIKGYGGSPHFGLLWRHWVYWAAARKLKRDGNKDREAPQSVL